MALLNCPECYRQISNLAVSCPNCGFPIACHLEKQKAELLKTENQMHLLKNINSTDCIVKHDRLGLRARVHECLRLEELQVRKTDALIKELWQSYSSEVLHSGSANLPGSKDYIKDFFKWFRSETDIRSDTPEYKKIQARINRMFDSSYGQTKK